MMTAFANIGTSELILILVVVLLIFGAKRIPEIARALGRATNEFKKAKDDILDPSKDHIAGTEKKADDAPQDAKRQAGKK